MAPNVAVVLRADALPKDTAPGPLARLRLAGCGAEVLYLRSSQALLQVAGLILATVDVYIRVFLNVFIFLVVFLYFVLW